MKKARFTALLFLGLAAAWCHPAAHAQAVPTATQALELSAFGGVSGVRTGVDATRNVSITAGANLQFRPFFSILPSITVRGTYPVNRGPDVGEKSVLAGLQFEKRLWHFHPYVDILYGRGEMDYVVPHADPAGNYFYEITSSNVLSPGLGVDFDMTHHLALKVDAQLEHYDTPVNASGVAYAKVGTIGVVYRFDFNHGHIR